jgi:hypothetical protein
MGDVFYISKFNIHLFSYLNLLNQQNSKGDKNTIESEPDPLHKELLRDDEKWLEKWTSRI